MKQGSIIIFDENVEIDKSESGLFDIIVENKGTLFEKKKFLCLEDRYKN